MIRQQTDDYLTATPKQPPMLTWEQAVSSRRPRRCNVPWHRRGGALCCENCTNQMFVGHPLQARCAASEDPPRFRPRHGEE